MQVIQDRLTISAENSARLIESIETALRFGKDRINFIDLETKKEFPFSTALALRPLRSRHSRRPHPALFSFNNPVRRVSRVPRLRSHDCDRSQPRHSRSRALASQQGAVRVLRGERDGRITEGSAPRLRPAPRSTSIFPSRNCRSDDQDFVINGEKGGGRIQRMTITKTTAGTASAVSSDWLESKTYKMHVRVLLSRYRAYTSCPSCDGGRFQPDTLNLSPRQSTKASPLLPCRSCRSSDRARRAIFSKAWSIPPNDSAAEMLRDEICGPAQLSLRSRSELSHARSLDPHPQRRRSATESTSRPALAHR